jgi:hypothetical protein
MALTLPSDGFESYAGNYTALDVVYDHFGTPLDNTAGHPHAGAWCCQFDTSDFLLYPKGAFSGTGLSETLFDNTFWLAHDAASNPLQAPLYAPEKRILVLLDGAGNENGCYVAISQGGHNLGVTSGWDGTRYRTPVGSLPGDSVYRKIRVQIALEGTAGYGLNVGTARLWVNDVLLLDAPNVALSGHSGAYRGTCGAIQIANEGGAGFTYFRLDDVNVLAVAARARLWSIE